MECRSYKQGEIVVRQGMLGDELFMIETGSAVASLRGKHLQTLEEGSHFGEMSFLANSSLLLTRHTRDTRDNKGHNVSLAAQAEDQFRSCDVFAAQDLECWVLSVGDFVEVVMQHPDDNAELMQALTDVANERRERVTRAVQEAASAGGQSRARSNFRMPRHLSRILSRSYQGGAGGEAAGGDSARWNSDAGVSCARRIGF
eukprot:Tamp_11640.p2 GENE.Tamp_11640~~Tamp_11640.p2  ORF type:complete len:201 (+),score=39.89 Tamp_11640:1034-1636(+)